MDRFKRFGKWLLELIRKSVILCISLLLGLIVMLAAVLLIVSHDPNSALRNHPSDKQLITNFVDHEVEFQQLAHLLEEKRDIVRVSGLGSCADTNGVLFQNANDPYCEKLIELIQAVGMGWNSASIFLGQDHLWVTVSTSGISVSGSEKGYYFSQVDIPKEDLVENTQKASGKEIYREIGNGWYIYLLR